MTPRPPPEATGAAQQAVASVIKLRYLIGTVTGLILTLGAGGGLGVMLGLAMYLPMSATLTYCLGCAVAWALEKYKGRVWNDDIGVPLAAGLLVGEGLAQVGLVAADLLRSAAGG
jgi:uncharacterized oligopeptide transporter (OPT) family protein